MGNFAENLNLGNRFRPPWFPEGNQVSLEAHVSDSYLGWACVFS